MIFESITEIYSDLTKAEKRIADYIIKNKSDTQYMTITSLAEACKVADATVTRFCKKLGVSGYNALKLEIATSGVAEVQSHKPNYTVNTDIKKLYDCEVSALTETLEYLNEEDIERAAHYLHSAQNIYCMGQGGSSVIAMEAWARFITVSSQFQWVQDSHFQSVTASLCNINDVIIFFSYTGSTRDILDVLRLAKNQKAKIILITRFPNCPAADYADVIILCGSKESPLQSGSIAAKISQLYIIDILFHQYCSINPQYSAINIDTTSKALADKHL